jgi:hypothetical protein
MKIGILTFQQTKTKLKSSHNYGGVLQAFALQEVIKRIMPSHEVEIIDYVPKIDLEHDGYYADLKNSINFISKVKNFIHLTLLLPKVIKRRRQFKNFFKKYYSLSLKTYTQFDKNLDYDVFIFGSDQIWNKSITKGIETVFWGDFITRENALKITYAVSSGMSQIEKKDLEYITKRLLAFDAISVRESSLKQLLESIVNKKIYHTLDPTLVMSTDVWNSFLIRPRIKNKYVLMYMLHANEPFLKMVEEKASILKCELIIITNENRIFSTKNNYHTLNPNEFVGWFKDAEYVFTNSFHGLAFSIIFNRPFVTLLNNNSRDERSLSLLHLLGIKGRAISSHLNVEQAMSKQLDWSIVNSKLSVEQSKSIDFLKNVIIQ